MLIRRRFAGAILAFLLPLPVLAQTPSAFPVDVAARPTPHPVMAEGRLRLAYELHLASYGPRPMELKSVEVLGDGGQPIASYAGPALEAQILQPGAASPDKPRTLDPGRNLVVFVDVTLAPGARAPARLRHRLTLSAVTGKGATVDSTFVTAELGVDAGPAPVLAPPLKGAGWLAANGLFGADHRRSLVPVDGRVRIAQRFAIDWIQLGPDGRLARGEGEANADFYAYGAPVLAVADARVIGVKDGLPDNDGSNTRRAVPITLETITGNYVVLDLGKGRYALYAHLKPGSLRVKVGDRVKTGQVIGLLGNSGNSDAPHLHFHLMDGASPLGAEGLPYVLSGFTQAGVASDPGVLEANKPWRPQGPPLAHAAEFPVDNAVVTFR